MSSAPSETTLPLDDVMLAMDVVDTLRHSQTLVERELGAEAREQQLIEKLREIYRQQGIEVPDHILREGVDALKQSRFVYAPPGPGLRTWLARLYVSRAKWGRWVVGSLVALIVFVVAYQFIYQPFVSAQREAAQAELAEAIPARMQAIYESVYQEAKVQAPIETARELLERGKQAAAESDRQRADEILAQMTDLRDTLRHEYVLRVVNRSDEQSGFWTFPESNQNATNYYIVVEAVNPEGDIVSLPIENEESGETETVNKWGLRVPSSVYNAVAADKRDDGIIQRNIVGQKLYGYLDIEYTVPVSGGAVTQW